MRTYAYRFTIACASQGEPDLAQVENMIDLSMQDLVEDSEFFAALDETVSVTIQVIQIGDQVK